MAGACSGRWYDTSVHNLECRIAEFLPPSCLLAHCNWGEACVAVAVVSTISMSQHYGLLCRHKDSQGTRECFLTMKVRQGKQVPDTSYTPGQHAAQHAESPCFKLCSAKSHEHAKAIYLVYLLGMVNVSKAEVSHWQ